VSLISQGNIMHHEVSQGITRCHKVSQGVTRCHKVSQGNKRCHMAEGTSKWLLLLYFDEQIYLETIKLLHLTSFLLEVCHNLDILIMRSEK